MSQQVQMEGALRCLVASRLFWFLAGVAITVLALFFAAPAWASNNCTRMKATDTLIFYGRRQHAEQFVECVVGHWPSVHTVVCKLPRYQRNPA
jgi:hypothetical protein